ncbi:hypothetical protein [[Clostridium] symbiosum]|uniref:hypothetical protein n=1 Tax=Clostridium symbiosum TaxID=1512 RepID=UPI00321BE34F
MATNTTNYSFKKPDESDFYDVQDQNGNWDMADEALKSLDTPTFEDYTGSTPVPAANTAIDGIKSKTKLSALMSNIKAAFKGACLIGHIVNNCVTNNPNLPLSAAQGKVLMDLYTQLNGDLITGIDKFPPANTGIQEITVNFPAPMKGTPKVFATWKDNANAFTYVDGLVIAEASSSGFKIATNRLKASENWWFCYVAICNR